MSSQGITGPFLGHAFWATYVALFGRERLLSTPAALVTEMAGGVYVQLTRDVADVTAHRDSYLVAQKAARQHLDSNAFLGEASPDKIRVPDFIYPTQ